MLNSLQPIDNLNKGFIKAGDLQRQLAVLRLKNPEIRPIDAANALLDWFQQPDNEFIRLDVLYYAISHTWGIVTEKMEAAPVHFENVRKQRKKRAAAKTKRAAVVAEAVDQAMEQMVATLKHLTFKQARMLHGAAAKLDLGRGADDQRLGDVFSDADIRSALS